jgi:hypothetical protein
MSPEQPRAALGRKEIAVASGISAVSSLSMHQVYFPQVTGGDILEALGRVIGSAT